MTQKNNPEAPSIHSASLGKRMFIGAAIALSLITCFLLSAGTPDPAWGKFWMIRPLIIVPLAGACGGMFYHLMDTFRYQGGWKKIAANVLSIVVFIIGLWVGTVLGLNGTMWN
jgi:hypothetical protein